MKTQRSLLLVALIVSIGLLCAGVQQLNLQHAYDGIEILTQLHAAELSTVINECATHVERPLDNARLTVEYFKIFEYSETYAKVFVVTQLEIYKAGITLPLRDRSGQFVSLLFQDGNWMCDPSRPPQLIWSDLGSADGETWPPYH
jgi:hypothetical protein